MEPHLRAQSRDTDLNLVTLALILVTAILLLLIFSPSPASAGTVTLQPIYDNFVNPLVETLLQGVALAIAGYLTYLAQKYGKCLPPFIHTWLDTKMAASLNTALANGVVIAMHKLNVVEAAHASIEVKGVIAEASAQYAINHASGAVARFGLDPAQLANKALAYIPTVPTTTDTTGAKIQTDKVEVRELAPLSAG